MNFKKVIDVKFRKQLTMVAHIKVEILSMQHFNINLFPISGWK